MVLSICERISAIRCCSGSGGRGIKILINSILFGQSGQLDTNFSGDGKVTTAIGFYWEYGYGSAIQTDGKIVVAGYSSNGSNNDFAVVRYNSDGSLDESFDVDGKVTTSIGPGNDFGQSVAIQTDGKIVVVGYASNGSNYDIAVVRYNSDGSLDTSFDGDGKVTTALGSGDDYGFSVALQSDGKIVVAGYSLNGSNNDIAVVRYNSDGTLDASFDGDGKVTTAIGSGDDYGYSVAIQTDGKIVVAGYANNGFNNDFAVIRYNSDGTLDASFDGDGKVTTAIGFGDNYGYSVAIQTDGKIVVAGYALINGQYDFAVVRYNSDGSLDTSFDGDGKTTTSVGSSIDYGKSVTIQTDGKII
ncbi:hypothetical protein D6827_00705, partial [Candidatus Parcubacteria bacterium]